MGFLSTLFVNPALLLAAAGAAVPIALHFIHRRRSREVPFSSLKFLKSSVKRTARRKRLEELALLALRVALIALLALALAGPFLGTAGRPGGPSYTPPSSMGTSVTLRMEATGGLAVETAPSSYAASSATIFFKTTHGGYKGRVVIFQATCQTQIYDGW